MRSVLITMLALSAGSLPALSEPLNFSDEALARGLNFNIGFNYLQYGAGLMLADLDGDGDLDAVIANGSGGNIGLFENDGTGNFTNRSIGSGFTNISVASGMAAADYDNDGDIDIFISGRYTNSRLYRNDGNLTFTDVAVSAGIVDNGPMYGACWGDVDQDGHLDLYVSVRTGDNGYVGSNHLYMNNGDGTFTDEALALDVDAEGDPTLVSAFFDFDRDGDDDLYLGTDKGSGGFWKNRLYLNNGGTFTEITNQANAQAHIDCMGIAVGDINFDGFYDMYLTNIMHGNKLLVHDGVGAYVDQTVAAGVGSYHVGWGTLFADFDNDTELDIYLCNMQGPNRLYRGSQTWPLIDEGPSANVAEEADVFCAAEGDVDGDGDIDLLVGNTNGRVRLYINNSPDLEDNNYVRFNVVGNNGEMNQFAVGTCVDITHGKKSQVRQVRSGTNYKSSSEYTLHFGLGDAQVVDSAQIIYPYFHEIRELSNIPVNREWTIYPTDRLGDKNDNGRIDSWELQEAILARTGPGNHIEPGVEIYDMDGDFDIDNDDLALMGLGTRNPTPKNIGHQHDGP